MEEIYTKPKTREIYTKPATAPERILELLTKRPGLNKYRIAKETGLSYSRVYESIQKLESYSMIKGEVIGKTRAGLDEKSYSLTVGGFTLLATFHAKGKRIPFFARKEFFDLITNDEKRPISDDSARLFEKNLDYLMENYKAFFPLIAGKWSFFKEKGIDRLVVKWLGFTDGSFDTTEYTRGVFVDLFADISKEPKTSLKVANALSEDPELRRVALESVKILHERHILLGRLTEKILRILERDSRPTFTERRRKNGGTGAQPREQSG